MRKLLLTTAATMGATVALAGGAFAQTATTPSTNATVQTTAPNSFNVHLNARINWYAGMEGSSADNQGGYKQDPYQFQGYIRVYPGFDAVAANGLKYGASAEIRMPGHGGGTAGLSPGSTSGEETLYWRRAYGYVGTDQLGTFQFGMVDGTMDTFYVGSFESFNDGAWNGDLPGFVPGSAVPAYPFSDVGAYYTANRVVYLSPTFSGFQFGVAFAPNTSNLWNAQCSVAGSSCNNLSASPESSDLKRWRNLIDFGGEYTGTVGPVGLNFAAAYAASNMVDYNGAPGAPTAPTGSVYEGYSYGDFGGTITIAGFQFGGQIGYGRMNGDWSPQPKGGVNELAFMLGTQYTTGPIVVGASYFKTKYAGGWTEGTTGVARAETDQGIAAGATYSLVPGMAIYLSYLYGLRHQLGYNFYTGATDTPVGNNTHSEAFSVGTVLKW
ncbi:MAG TPA: porin [Acetobacteraceae bacterium]|nr:porin [Acetobacteraceae bacterium]